ncbi:Uncharacterised protein [Streptococcus pneumoniae]|uniref:hypothetical protein n=1 Tax=Streptococcus pneumoniae TaxID=1313 RepID=UPI0002310E76|nr:hypothetical protein [Streptococcus pneumoniae]EHD60841.1 phage protein [Streptococcus pneumoniae GA44500]VSY33245.1 Uncharacterised protein [Streptococcus pneumoniae]
MNKYKKLIELIENNGLEIQSKKCYDPQSAWHGEELWIVDKKNKIKFLIYQVTVTVFMTLKLRKPLKKLRSIYY